MTATPGIALERIMPPRLGSVDPSGFPDEKFDLYSIPAFDQGEPEVLEGSAIGSAKQIVQPGDVLLSRIVPHIRRAWVVGPDRGRRIIASGEWIVFRSTDVDQRYLRHVLVSDPFHAEFMRTVSGVGGSLLRARPAYVAKIKIPLPPLREQRRIAEILDKADALRAKRRAALCQLATLTQSIFLDMFGDPATNPMRFPRVRLDALVREDDSINYGVLQPGDDCEDGVPLIRVGDLQNDTVEYSALKRISPSIESAYKRSRLRGDEILISCVGSTGTIALADESMKGFNIARAVARIPLANCIDRLYVASYLQSQSVQRYFSNELRTVSQPTLNIKQISETVVLVPPLELQREYAQRVEAVIRLRDRQRKSLSGLNAVFASIQARAFRGEL